MIALKHLADLIQRRNVIDAEIAKIVGRPAEKGHVGEFIAATLFGIALEQSATTAGYDGRFRAGPFAGRTVNIKWYAKREGLLDINPLALPDLFLVLAGPRTAAAGTRGTTRPWTISEIFLFETPLLLERLRARGTKVGVATSIPGAEWEAARIWPGNGARLSLADGAEDALRALSG